MAEQRVQRRLAAILAADVVGYTRLMELDEAGTLASLKARRREILDPLVAKHQGRVFKLVGDGVLVEFASAVNAVLCSVDLQQAFAVANSDLPDDRQIVLRIGVSLGDVIVEGSDLYGEGVNVAARLEGLADPRGIWLSEMVYESVKAKVDLTFEDLGEQLLKNISEPIRAFRIQLGGVAGPVSRRAPTPPLPDKPSIAVLAFKNMSGDPEQEYFSDGITEDIITELSRFRFLFVIARNSSFYYKGRSLRIQQVGRELGVRYVVEGSVRKAGSRVRVSAQLIDSETGNHLWAERYDRNLEDIFAVQDEVAREIASAVPGQLDDAAIDRARRKPSQSLTAYDCLLRGEWLIMQDYGAAEALRLFQRAIEIDPQCARAYCRLAEYYGYSIFAQGTPVEEAQRLTQSFAELALASEPNDARVQVIAAHAYQFIGEHDLSRRHLDKAIALNPNDITVMRSAGQILAYLGDHADAQDWYNRFLRLDPHVADGFRESQFDLCYMMHRYDEAIMTFQGWPNPRPHMYCQLAAAYAHLNRMDEARAAVAAFERRKPAGYDVTVFVRAHARMCRRKEDGDNWIEGYRKAGFPV